MTLLVCLYIYKLDLRGVGRVVRPASVEVCFKEKHMRPRRLWLGLSLALALAVAGCSSDDDAAATNTTDTSDDAAAVDHGGDTSTSTQQALVAADSVVNFDPTLDTTKTAEENAQAIAANVTASLNGCGSVTAAGTTVTVDFGAAPGCTLSSGVQISGTIKAEVSKASNTVTVKLTLTNVVIEGKSVAGTVTLSTSDAKTYAVTTSLTAGSNSITGSLTVTGAQGSMTVSGTTSAVKEGVSASLKFTALHYTYGDCYPDGGSVTVQRGKASIVYTFDANTPTTGTVSMTSGKKTTSTQLPAYGSCPGAGFSTSAP